MSTQLAFILMSRRINANLIKFTINLAYQIYTVQCLGQIQGASDTSFCIASLQKHRRFYITLHQNSFYV